MPAAASHQAVQRKASPPVVVPEQPADPAAEPVMLPRFAGVVPGLQRAPDGSSPPAPPPAVPGVQAPAGQVLVDDGAAVAPGQMARGPFMAALRAQLFAACDQELAAVGRSADGCPYLNQWLA